MLAISIFANADAISHLRLAVQVIILILIPVAEGAIGVALDAIIEIPSLAEKRYSPRPCA